MKSGVVGIVGWMVMRRVVMVVVLELVWGGEEGR